ncbi:MAG TPA: RHS repeat-associated core domain-containing protein [Terriglobales bacterium]|nr:RHS repeat-associated core domain-containing protein [Terriglobales bacterium]
MTDSEYEKLAAVAEQDGQTLGEWCREVLLERAEGRKPSVIEETGLDNFLAREFTSQFGRFSQPDPAGLAAVDLSDPQSLNRYSYVRNNPANLIDPLGLESGDPCTVVDSHNVNCPGTTITVHPTPPLPPPPQCFFLGLCDGYGYGNSVCGYMPYGCSNQGGVGIPSGGGGGGGTPNQQTQPQSQAPPWYKTCTAKALGKGAVNLAIDALGFLPEVGGVARVVGHQAGYVGKVADNVGKNMLTAGTKTTGFLNSATGIDSSDWTTWVSAGITAADFVPGLSDITTPAALIWDAGIAAHKTYQCP